MNEWKATKVHVYARFSISFPAWEDLLNLNE